MQLTLSTALTTDATNIHALFMCDVAQTTGCHGAA